MAREYAQIKLAIWADDDWRDLSPMARYLYLSLLTSPTLSHCGVADWRPRRLSAITGMEPEEVEEFGDELRDSLHLVIDEDTEEALIRSFIRHDGLMKQPKMASAMATAHAAISSPTLRGVVVHELIRLREDHPELHGWGSEKASALLAKRSVNPSTYPTGKGSVKGSVKGKATPTGKGSVKGSPTPAPTPTPNSHTPVGGEADASEFDSFWSIYPRKEAKGTARRAWDKALRRATVEQILAGAETYAAKVAGSERKFIAHPSSWLNADRWEDEDGQTLEADADTTWGRPTLPAAPPEIADDPQLYAAWLAEQRRAQ